MVSSPSSPDDSWSVDRPVEGVAALRDVHALDSGAVQIVGDAGNILLRDEEGEWTHLTSPSGRDLLGIDAIGQMHH